MRIVNKYMCERCGTLYSNEGAAIACENNHKQNGEIVGMLFRSKEDTFPYEIGIKFDNDVVTYRCT